MKDLRSLAAGLTFLASGGIAAAPARALAQAGPYAPLALSLPAGAKPLAFGNVGVASRDDDVLFYNPAQLVVARGMSGSFERYSANSLGGTLSSVTRFSNNAFAIGARFADYRDALVVGAVGGSGPGNSTPVTLFPVDRRIAVGSGLTEGLTAEATVGYATTFKGFRLGASAKYATDEVPGVRLQKGAVDVGVARDVARFYTVALAVQNIGESTSLACLNDGIRSIPCLVAAQAGQTGGVVPDVTLPVYLPLRTTLGGSFSHELGEFDFASTAAVSLLRSNLLIPAGGGELGYSWLDGYSVAVRAGARRPLPGEGTFTAGAGFTVDHLSIDYALETLSGSRVAHRIGLRIR